MNRPKYVHTEEEVDDRHLEADMEEELSAHVYLQELIEAGQVMGQEDCAELIKKANRMMSENLHPEAQEMIDIYKALVGQGATPRADGAFSLTGSQEEDETLYRCPACPPDDQQNWQEEEERPTGSVCQGCGLGFAGKLENPQATTQHQTIKLGDLEIEIWWRAKHPGALSQDQCVAELLPDGRVRVAVIDGVTPASGLTPSAAAQGSNGGGVNGASYAASLTRQELKKGGSIEQALNSANQRLQNQFGQEGLYSRAMPQATAVAFDIHPDGRIEGLRGGTDQAYALNQGQVENLFPGPINNPQAEKEFTAQLAAQDQAARKANPNISQEEMQTQVRFPLEEKYYSRENWWGGAAIGRFPEAKLIENQGRMPEELIMCSDGARINSREEESRLFDLAGWMNGGLQNLEAGGKATDGNASDKKTDDVTVIRIRKSPNS